MVAELVAGGGLLIRKTKVSSLVRVQPTQLVGLMEFRK